MTLAQQRRFYFPAWHDAATANDWVMVKGRLLARRQEKFGREETTRLYNQVWDAAELLAQNAHRAVTANDLRHACHLVALVAPPVGPAGSNDQCSMLNLQSPQIGKLLSSKDLTTAQTTRVVRLFEILADPNDIDAMLAWLDPSIDKRKSLVRWINSMAPEAYICQLAKMFPAFQYPFWEDLPPDNLLSLARLIRKRCDQRQVPISALHNREPRAEPVLATSDLPPALAPIDLSKNKPF